MAGLRGACCVWLVGDERLSCKNTHPHNRSASATGRQLHRCGAVARRVEVWTPSGRTPLFCYFARHVQDEFLVQTLPPASPSTCANIQLQPVIIQHFHTSSTSIIRNSHLSPLYCTSRSSTYSYYITFDSTY